ncbi:tubulin delta chain-like [Lineus longissimus]|uniref:tubulin delta chain-like n=1 Tax=Lineus longissimus TaxID=88925 RepID=UPI002B4C5E31
MSSVVVQVGQCGNQVGQQFWKHVLHDKQQVENNSSVYVHPDGKFRSVNIDAEPKVVRRLMKDAKKSNFRESNIIVGRQGCGTNWAIGYHGVRTEHDKLISSCVEGLRKEIERCDTFCGVIMMHSLSGGTGSGLGSHLAEVIRDEYPMNYLLSGVVAPYKSGESPLQHYNTLLTTAHLQRYSDGIILFQNDEVLYQLSKKSRDGGVGISFSKMNEQIASCLCGTVLPIDTLSPKRYHSIGIEPWELVRSVCPMPSMKFIYTNQVSRNKCSWDNLTTALLNSHNRYNKNGEPYRTLSNLVIVRGDRNNTFPSYTNKMEEKIKLAYNTVKWNPFPVDFWRGSHNTLGAMKDSTSLTLASNNSNIVEYLEDILEKSRAKYDARAYLHWYWKHGCTGDDFEDAFTTLQTIVDDYKESIS